VHIDGGARQGSDARQCFQTARSVVGRACPTGSNFRERHGAATEIIGECANRSINFKATVVGRDAEQTLAMPLTEPDSVNGYACNSLAGKVAGPGQIALKQYRNHEHRR
jgi:hypothetical protein